MSDAFKCDDCGELYEGAPLQYRIREPEGDTHSPELCVECACQFGEYIEAHLSSRGGDSDES